MISPKVHIFYFLCMSVSSTCMHVRGTLWGQKRVMGPLEQGYKLS